MDAKIQNELDFIKKSILQTVPAEAIYLFGSYAYGTPTEESDLDIYVVVPDDTRDLFALQADIRELLWKKKSVSLDILMGRSSVFNRRKYGPTLERTIAQKGTVLYGA
ncbi:MAG: nucleotidyltransferase domain-containing protein [Firmicutes bacterium]|nr:nucleotidyltransferase domain-containing protein [Bacillota bacterium]